MPNGDIVRPTADRVREAWMSIVQPWIPGARVLDLFAGSGALGIEALSRGAGHVDFVETATPSLNAIGENLTQLGVGSEAKVHKMDAFTFLDVVHADAYDIAFADPPYDKGHAAKIAELWLATPFAAILGVEHNAWEKLPDGGEKRKYGSTAITFFRTR
ncbi:MAG: methyltransferase [Gemmatimonadetes bacterium]|nr:methyltransferase [Gemmatimonadota bacterium]